MRNSSIIRAFTLVEMLLVVAVIALLISILLPALAKSRDLAMRTVCATRLAQCGNVQKAYALDQRNRWLAAFNNSPGDDCSMFYRAGGHDLRVMLKSWVGGFDIWNCPSLDVPSISHASNTRTLSYSGYKYWQLDNSIFPSFGTGKALPRSVRMTPPTLPVMQDRFDDRRTQAILTAWYVNHADRFTISNWGPVNGNPSITNKLATTMNDAQGANINLADGSTRWTPTSLLVFVGDDSNINISPTYSVLP